MTKSKDLNFIAKLEKEISQRWGDEAVENPKKHWTPEKEQKHEEEVREFYKRRFFKDEKKSKENYKGFLITKKLLTRETTILNCPVCTKRLRTVKDDIYNSKFECCQRCYIEYVENREERWLNGWRPGDK